MLEAQILQFIKDYINLLSDSMSESHPEFSLTRIQRLWLCTCLRGILMTNKICWSSYERSNFGYWKSRALSWMFRHSKISWDKLLEKSIGVLLKKHNITEGTLELDETDKERSKNAKCLYKLGKQKDKKSGGYFNGQSIVFMILVTDTISIPVGFAFYEMDPVLRAWRKEETRLKKRGVQKKHRKPAPKRDSAYPTKVSIGLKLVSRFKADFGHIKIRAVKADALYGTAEFVDGVASLYPNSQVISQIRNNQKIVIKGKEQQVSAYFKKRASVKRGIIIRGGKQQVIYYSSVIAKVQSHGKKRLIIALKYEGEATYRYIIAQNMTWRVQDVLECFSLRWLVEVFFQDWKTYEGWGQLTKHVGAEGSRQSLILSLLFDHCLLSHPIQTARIKDNLPLYTVGSLRNKLSIQSLIQIFAYILEQPDPKKYLGQLMDRIDESYLFKESSKHMSGRVVNFGNS